MQRKRPYISKPTSNLDSWTNNAYGLGRGELLFTDVDRRNPFMIALALEYTKAQSKPLPVVQTSPGFSFVDDDPESLWEFYTAQQNIINARDKFVDMCVFGIELKAHKKAMRRLRKRKNYSAHAIDLHHPYFTDAENRVGNKYAKLVINEEDVC